MESIANVHEMRKSSRDRKIAGVCGGLGEYTALPSWVWRAVFLATICLGGVGVIAYAVLWIFMPVADPANEGTPIDTYPALRKVRKSAQDKMIGGVCGGLGEHTSLPSWLRRAIFLTAVFFGGAGLIAYIVLWISLPANDGRENSS